MAAAMSDFVLTENTSPEGRRCAHLQLGAALTIVQAQELREALLAALSCCEELEIAVESVEEVDVTGLQSLCSVHRTALLQDRTLRLSGRDQGPWPHILKESGFARHEACAQSNARRNCLWC